MPAEPPGPTPQPSQATLVWAVRLLAAEAAALFLLVIFLAYEGLTATAGSAIGNMTRQNVAQSLQPSMRAASSSSEGIWAKKARSR